jgi:hypothetical protein
MCEVFEYSKSSSVLAWVGVMFLKYRFKFSSGSGQWEWIDLHECYRDDEAVKEWLREKAHEMYYDDGEHYRGFVWEINETPPKEWLEEQVESMRASIAYYSKRIKKYERILNEDQKNQ